MHPEHHRVCLKEFNSRHWDTVSMATPPGSNSASELKIISDNWRVWGSTASSLASHPFSPFPGLQGRRATSRQSKVTAGLLGLSRRRRGGHRFWPGISTPWALEELCCWDVICPLHSIGSTLQTARHAGAGMSLSHLPYLSPERNTQEPQLWVVHAS